MKRPLLFTFAVLLALTVAGQQSPQSAGAGSSGRLSEVSQKRKFLADNPLEEKIFSKRDLLLKSSLKSSGDFLKQLDSVFVEAYDFMADQLLPENGYRFIYDANDNMIKEIAWKYDKDHSNWIPDWLEEYTFDEAGNITLLVMSSWDGIEGDWYPDSQEEYIWDANGNIERIIESSWDYDEGVWVLYWLNEYIYDAAGRIEAEYTYSWDLFDEEWLEDYKTEFEYDQDGNTEFITYFEWDWDIDDWAPEYRFQQVYDSEGNYIESYTFHYDADAEEWEPFSKTLYTRDTDGLATMMVIHEPGDEPDEWDPVTKFEYDYDNNRNLVTETIYYMDEDEGWIPASRNEFTVDQSYTSDQVLSPYYMIYFWPSVNMITGITNYFNDDGSWSIMRNTTLFYSDYEPGEEPESYNLTVSISGNGTVEVNGNTYTEPLTFDSGTQITLSAVPAANNEFSEWTGDAQSAEVTINLTMDGNKSVTATFSVVSSLQQPDETGPVVFPNPFRDNITITNAGDIRVVKITSMAGQVLTEITPGSSETIVIPAEDLADGAYLLVITARNGERIVKRIVKN